jgi:hypothetical protein
MNPFAYSDSFLRPIELLEPEYVDISSEEEDEESLETSVERAPEAPASVYYDPSEVLEPGLLVPPPTHQQELINNAWLTRAAREEYMRSMVVVAPPIPRRPLPPTVPSRTPTFTTTRAIPQPWEDYVGDNGHVNSQEQAAMLVRGSVFRRALMLRQVVAPRYATSSEEYRLYHMDDDSMRRVPGGRLSAAILRETFDNRDVMRLALEILRTEQSAVHPKTGARQSIKAVYMFFTDRRGIENPRPLIIPVSQLQATTKEQLDLLLARLTDRGIDDFMAEMSELQGSDPELKYGEGWDDGRAAIRLMPNRIGVVVNNPMRTAMKGSRANGLPDKLMAYVANMKSAGGREIEDLDVTKEGFCLVETAATLVGMRVEYARRAFGDKDPSEITLETCATGVANIVQANLHIYQQTRDKKLVLYLSSQTSFVRTLELYYHVFCYKEDGEVVKYGHVYHLMGAEVEAVEEPHTVPTIMIQLDLETVASTDKLINMAWGLNLLAYRIPPGILTGKIYNPEELKTGVQFFNPDSREWVVAMNRIVDETKRDASGKPVLKMVVTEEAKLCPRVYIDGELDVLRHLIPFIKLVADHSPPGCNFTLVGYNSSRFDNFITVPYLLARKIGVMGIGVFGNSILQLNLRLLEFGININTLDICRHMPGSLRNNGANWGVPEGGEKGDLDHRLIQTIYTMNPTGKELITPDGNKIPSFSDFLKANEADVLKYCKNDVISCALLHSIYKVSMEFIVNKYFIPKYGASIALASLLGELTQAKKGPGYAERITKFIIAAGAPPGAVAIGERGLDARIRRLLNSITLSNRTYSCIQVLRHFQMLPEKYDIEVPANVATDPDVINLANTPPKLRAGMASTVLKLLESSIGGKLVESGIRPNVEQHMTLASYAESLYLGLCRMNEVQPVGGFRLDVTKTLREYACIAGRSEAKVGIFEEEPIVIVDIVSLYPTAMTCPRMHYATGSVGEDDNPLVRTTYRSEYVEPVNGAMRPGIWKVLVHDQPNGVVAPERTKLGIHWSNRSSKDTYQLKLTPDIESLKISGATFEVLEGLTFDDVKADLYHEYIGIFRDEKNRQDTLRRDSSVALYPGEVYSAGIREGTKLGMNILSGKEVMKPHYVSRRLTTVPGVDMAMDLKNEQLQILKERDARRALDAGNLSLYKAIKSTISQIPRMDSDPEELTENVFLSSWRDDPKLIKQSHINGYHIYATSRLIMNEVYSLVGFDNFLVTETDSLALPVKLLPRLYGHKSVFGDPCLFVNDEKRLGLLPEAPSCTKGKQFGQLEIETTEKLISYSMKALNLKDPKLLKKIHFEGTHLMANDIDTGYTGPFLAVGGKKIYCQYLKDHTGKIIPLKSRFKGLSFGRDMVIGSSIDVKGLVTHVHGALGQKLMTASKGQLLEYANAVMTDIPSSAYHPLDPMDIFDYIREGKIVVLQTRISENDTKNLFSKQNALIKTLYLRRAETFTLPMLKEIRERSNHVKGISLRAMSRAINSGYEYNDSLCELCDQPSTRILNLKNYCAIHSPEADEPVKTICNHKSTADVYDCGNVAHDGKLLCSYHLNASDPTPEIRYCSLDGCKNPADTADSSIDLCRLHLKEHKTAKVLGSTQCAYLIRGMTQCGKPVQITAIRSGYLLCPNHYHNLYYHKKNDPSWLEGALISEADLASQFSIVSTVTLAPEPPPPGSYICSIEDCGKAADPSGLQEAVFLCPKHLNTHHAEKVVASSGCGLLLSGKTRCNKPSQVAAIQAGYLLCPDHYHNLCRLKKRPQSWLAQSVLTPDARETLLASVAKEVRENIRHSFKASAINCCLFPVGSSVCGKMLADDVTDHLCPVHRGKTPRSVRAARSLIAMTTKT